MQNKSVVVKNNCHSREMLSGISSALENTRWGSPIKAFEDDASLIPPHPSVLAHLSSPARGRGEQPVGFTLIELLVVVLIIGILAAVAVPQYQMAVIKSRVGAMLSLATSIANAQEVCYLSQGDYTIEPANLDIDMPSSCTAQEDRPGIFICGTDFTLSLGGSGAVNLNYCSNHNQSHLTCLDNLDIHISFRLQHWNNANEREKRLCVGYSSMGRSFCANLAGFETREQ